MHNCKDVYYTHKNINYTSAQLWYVDHLPLAHPKQHWPIELLQDALPSVFGTVSFKTFSLGEQHPEIREIGVAHGKQNQSLGAFARRRTVQRLGLTPFVFALVISKELQSHPINQIIIPDDTCLK